MIIAHLTSVHPELDTRIFYKMCSSLARSGYNVHLVFITKDRESIKCIENVFLHGVLYEKTGRFRRMIFAAWRVYKKALSLRADIYHFHDPELIPFGLLLKLQGKLVVYDVHEDYPISMLDREYLPKGIRLFVSKFLRLVEHLAGVMLDGVVVATPKIAHKFKHNNTLIIQNFPDLNLYQEEKPTSLRPSHERYIVYVGSISKARGLFQMLDAIQMLKAHSNVKLRLAGTFSPPLLEKAARSHPGWNRTDYVGRVSQKELYRLLRNAIVGLVLFHPLGNHTDSQPNKLFEYMFAEIPVVASDFPLWRNIICSSGCGLLANPLNSLEIADRIDWLLAHPIEACEMGKRGKRDIILKFNWQTEFKKLVYMYNKIAL